MSEETKVRLRVVSRMTEPDGDVHEMKNARRGTIHRTADDLVLEYDDEQDGEKAHIILTMNAGESRARMQRRGMMSGTLMFVPGERLSGSYVTIYGEIPVMVDTRRVQIGEESGGGSLLLDYDVYMGGERTSGAQMEITWRI